MSLNPSDAFLAKNALASKTPMYVVDFQVDPDIDTHVKYCNYVPKTVVSTTPTPNISFISGGSYSITPDEGTSSSAQLKIELQDQDGDVTSMLSTATGNLQKKKCQVKAGYIGMDEADMLNVFFGEVTDYAYSKDGTWTITVSDAVRELNKYVFGDAGDDTQAISISGNPITLILALLMSIRGDQTNGPYDILVPDTDRQAIGIGMDQDKIDIETFEDIRDTYYPGTSVTFRFLISEREKANDFLKNEFYKPLNMYPIVRGNGQYSATIYSPPLPPYGNTALTEEDMVDVPDYDGNLTALINEVQFSYDLDISNDYHEITLFADADSINTRGVGDRTLDIEAKGLHSDTTDTDTFLERSSNRIFARYSVPPVKLSVTTTFDKLLIESGDVILVSNKFLPNLETGDFEFEQVPMEVLKRAVNWKTGSVSLELLQTGYKNRKYAAISPSYTVAVGLSITQFTVESTKEWDTGFVGTMYSLDALTGIFRLEEEGITVTGIDLTTNTITTSPMTTIPSNGWRFVFGDFDDQTVLQKTWGVIKANVVEPAPDGYYYYIIP